MISSLLKNRGLRLQLLVGLLLVLGTFPERSEGLQCYYCKSADGDDCTQAKATDCSSDEGYCIKQTRSWGTSKYCLSTSTGDCLKNEFGSSCKTETDPIKKDNLIEVQVNCALSRNQRKGEEDDSPYTACVCNTDLCNTGSSGGHSTSVIISAILTVALYNFIRSGTLQQRR